MIEERDLKQIPYGVSNFKEFRDDNYYYVDKTRYIRDMERKGRYLFFIRPRRFGKSLFLGILEAYYDTALKDRFDFFFKGTEIHQNPTKERNSYMILKLNFSAVSASISMIEDSFIDYIKESTYLFILKYEKLLEIDSKTVKEELFSKKNASEVMVKFLNICKWKAQQLYVIIDEYDNFANTILSESGEQAFEDITHGTGFLRAFFNVLKAGTTDIDAPISRLFITGVSPITMDDVTSGFNIAENISLDADINEMLGFTSSEVETMIDYYRQTGKIHHTTPELMEIMSQWYNHYRFSIHSTREVFNTIHVLYFLKEYMKNAAIPDNLIDHNARFDYYKLRHLIIVDKQGTTGTNGNFSKLQHVIETNTAHTYIQTGFTIKELIQPENFYSLLFYFGLLTIKGTSPSGQAVLAIPNEFVKRLYYDFVKETYKETLAFNIDLSNYSRLMEEMAFTGNWQALVEYIADRMGASLGLRDLMAGEKACQVFWNVYLGLSPLYNVYSENEMNQGFADLTLIPLLIQYPAIKYSYLIEFKYIKPSEHEAEDSEKILELKETAENQLRHYALDEKFQKAIVQTTLKKLVLIFCGNRLIYRGEA